MAFKTVQVRAVRKSDNSNFYYNSYPWKIPHDGIDGVDGPAVEVYTASKGFGHGDILTGMRLMSREITIKAKCELQGPASESPRISAKNFHRFVNSDGDAEKYDVYVTYKDNTAIAKDCVLKSFRNPTKNIYQQETITAVFECMDPYMYDSSGKQVGGV